MRNLYYKLADGTITKSYKEALASGQSFTNSYKEALISGQSFKTILEREPMAKPVLSEKRKEMLVKLH